MHSLSFPGGASGFIMASPVLRNYRVWRGTSQIWGNPAYKVWLDETKRA